jgi:ornithine cyclodeaminase/alanine dehydrogenase-like protein (mu-crystallin family)
MTRVLDDAQVRELITMPECVAAMEVAYADLKTGQGIYRVRTDMVSPATAESSIFSLKSMDGVVPRFGVGSIRINSDILRYRTDGNKLRRDRVPADDEGRYVGFILVFSTTTGEVLMLYPDSVQSMRVAAITALGIRYLARKDSRTIALIGSGVQARAQVEAALVVTKPEVIRCYSTNKENREQFCAAMARKHGVNMLPVEHPEDAVKGADIVLCGTNSRSHVFLSRWLEPGMHVSCINMFEFEPAVIKAADVVSTHIRDCDPVFIKTAGVGTMPEEPGAGYQDLAATTDFANLPTIADYIGGDLPGRTSESQITCMVNSVGCGYQFAVVGYLLNKKAREKGIGLELPSQLFTSAPER